MKNTGLFLCVLSILWFFCPALSSEKPVSLQFEMARQRLKSRPSDYIFGGHLMTPDERLSYIFALQQAQTPLEKQFIQEHHRREILERAKKRDPSMWQRYRSQ